MMRPGSGLVEYFHRSFEEHHQLFEETPLHFRILPAMLPSHTLFFEYSLAEGSKQVPLDKESDADLLTQCRTRICCQGCIEVHSGIIIAGSLWFHSLGSKPGPPLMAKVTARSKKLYFREQRERQEVSKKIDG